MIDMTKFKCILIIITLILLFLPESYAGEDERLYSQAVAAVRSGDMDFAFMHLHMILTTYPQSRFAEDSLFAIGEYYFSIADYYDAQRAFNQFIDQYPQSKAKVFALAYLLEIFKIKSNAKLVKRLKEELAASERVSFLFRDFKEYKYSSDVSKSYRALYFIDKIVFYIDGELFAQVSY